MKHTDVQTWIARWGRGRSPTTVHRAYGVLAGVLDGAVRDRRIAINPARDVKLPSKSKPKKKYLSLAQVELFVSQVRTHKVLAYVLAYTGLRWGEATGLRVRSVDLDRHRLWIEENAVMVGGEVHIGSTKSDEARGVPYPLFLHEDITRLCAGRSPDMILFGNGISHLKLPHSQSGWFAQAVADARP